MIDGGGDRSKPTRNFFLPSQDQSSDEPGVTIQSDPLPAVPLACHAGSSLPRRPAGRAEGTARPSDGIVCWCRLSAVRSCGAPRLSTRRRQRLYKPTFGDRAIAALADEIPELAAKRGEIADLPLDRGEMFAGKSIDSATLRLLLISEAQQVTDGLDGEAEIAAAPNKAQAPKVIGPVGAVVTGRPIRRRQQADVLIVPDRFGLRVRRLAKRADRQVIFHGLDLDLVVAIRSI